MFEEDLDFENFLFDGASQPQAVLNVPEDGRSKAIMYNCQGDMFEDDQLFHQSMGEEEIANLSNQPKSNAANLSSDDETTIFKRPLPPFSSTQIHPESFPKFPTDISPPNRLNNNQKEIYGGSLQLRSIPRDIYSKNSELTSVLPGQFEISSRNPMGTSSPGVNTKVPRCPAKRRFPGPAGILPRIVPGSTKLVPEITESEEGADTLGEQNQGQEQEEEEDIDVDSCVVWRRAIRELDMDKPDALVNLYNTAWIKQRNDTSDSSDPGRNSKKIPFFLVKVKSINMSKLDPPCVLIDKQGEVSGSVHRQVVDKYAAYIYTGTVLALKDVAVVITPKTEYVIITLNSLLAIYSPQQVKHLHHVTTRDLESAANALKQQRQVQLADIAQEEAAERSGSAEDGAAGDQLQGLSVIGQNLPQRTEHPGSNPTFTPTGARPSTAGPVHNPGLRKVLPTLGNSIIQNPQDRFSANGNYEVNKSFPGGPSPGGPSPGGPIGDCPTSSTGGESVPPLRRTDSRGSMFQQLVNNPSHSNSNLDNPNSKNLYRSLPLNQNNTRAVNTNLKSPSSNANVLSNSPRGVAATPSGVWHKHSTAGRELLNSSTTSEFLKPASPSQKRSRFVFKPQPSAGGSGATIQSQSSSSENAHQMSAQLDTGTPAAAAVSPDAASFKLPTPPPRGGLAIKVPLRSVGSAATTAVKAAHTPEKISSSQALIDDLISDLDDDFFCDI